MKETLGKGRGQIANLNYSDELAESVKDINNDIFEGTLTKYSDLDKGILILKAYANMVKGCTLVKISPEVPEDEIDHYKQYDRKVSVKFYPPNSKDLHRFYMSKQKSGSEEKFYWKILYLHTKKRLEEVQDKYREFQQRIIL